MQRIDPNKLRKYRDDSVSAYAALQEISRRYRDAADDLSFAENALERQKGGRAEKDGAAMQEAERNAKAARARLRSLDEAVEAAREVAEHRGQLWTRCRDFARANGALPSDLAD